jgi:hypothetical protein
LIKDYHNILSMEEFVAAGNHLNYLLKSLRSEQIMQAQHGEVEEHLKTQGAEFLRLLLQGHLDQRAKSQTLHEEVRGMDGIKRNNRRKDCKRSLVTVFGEVIVSRISYSSPGAASIFPLDQELNLPPDKYSHGLRKVAAEEACHKSFDDTVDTIQRNTAGKVPKFQAEHLVQQITQDFESFYEGVIREKFPRTKDPLILSIDGKGIVMRTDSLRPETQKAAARNKHKMQTRLSKGEKSGRKRMATVATVYDIERNIRLPEDIIRNYNSEHKSKPAPRARNKRVWASVARGADVVTGEMLAEALKRDPKQRREWVILVDGQRQQLRNIRTLLYEFGINNYTIIIDFVHVLEYLWKAAYAFFPEGSAKAESWVQERALGVLSNNARNVAGGIRRSANHRKISDSAREAIDTCCDYLIKYAPLMNYCHYMNEGFPIATGVIEGACRHLIKDRLDITGARWGLHGAEAILKIRSLKSSGDFEKYWQFHITQEQARNHGSNYSPISIAA